MSRLSAGEERRVFSRSQFFLLLTLISLLTHYLHIASLMEEPEGSKIELKKESGTEMETGAASKVEQTCTGTSIDTSVSVFREKNSPDSVSSATTESISSLNTTVIRRDSSTDSDVQDITDDLLSRKFKLSGSQRRKLKKENLASAEQSTLKRSRSDTTPGSQKQATKKLRSYAEATLSDFIAYVKRTDNLPVDAPLAEHIRNLIIDRQYSDLTFIPKFINSGLVGDMFKVTCNDKESFEWFMKYASRLPAIEGVKLSCLKHSELPPAIKYLAFFPMKTSKDIKQIFQRLKASNSGLHTERWQIAFISQKPGGILTGLGIDESSSKVLEGLNFNPFFEMSTIQFQRAKKSDSAKEHPTAVVHSSVSGADAVKETSDNKENVAARSTEQTAPAGPSGTVMETTGKPGEAVKAPKASSASAPDDPKSIGTPKQSGL